MFEASLAVHDLHYASPFRFGATTLTYRPFVQIRLMEGANAGYGEAAPLEGFGTDAFDGALHAVRDAVLWLAECPRVAAMWRRASMPPSSSKSDDLMDHANALRDILVAADAEVDVATPTARGAVSTALIDLWSQTHRMSFAHALGLVATNVPAQAGVTTEDALSTAVSCNAVVGGGALEAIKAEVSRAAQAGFSVVKLKVASGEASLVDESAMVSRLLSDYPSLRFRLDANGGWDRDAALRFMTMLPPNSLEYIEQPVPARDVASLCWLAKNGTQRVAADEALLNGPETRATILSNPSIDTVVIKPALLGGPLPAIEYGAAARAQGKRVVVTTSLDGVVGRAMAAHVARWFGGMAHGLDTRALLSSDYGVAFGEEANTPTRAFSESVFGLGVTMTDDDASY